MVQFGSTLALFVILVGCGARQPAPDAVGDEGAAQDERADEEAPRMRIGIPRELRPEEPAPEPEPSEPEPSEPEPSEPSEPAPEPYEPEPASVEPEAPETAGWTYLRDARRHVAHTYRDEIEVCFAAAGARTGPLSGRLVVAMVPHPDGRVASSRVIENGTPDPELGECVVQAAREWELPAPPRRTLEVQLRFTMG